MNALMANWFLLAVVLMTGGGLTAPISSYHSTDAPLNSSTNANVITVTTNIDALQVKAAREIVSVFEEIKELENYNASFTKT